MQCWRSAGIWSRRASTDAAVSSHALREICKKLAMNPTDLHVQHHFSSHPGFDDAGVRLDSMNIFSLTTLVPLAAAVQAVGPGHLRLSDAEWRMRSPPPQYAALRREGSERAGSSALNPEKRAR